MVLVYKCRFTVLLFFRLQEEESLRVALALSKHEENAEDTEEKTEEAKSNADLLLGKCVHE